MSAPVSYGQQQILEFLGWGMDSIRQAFASVPGSNILIKYIKNSHQNDPFR